MKKLMLSLMVAGLSLISIPELKAGTIAPPVQQTEVAVPPVMQKKIDAFKKKHPDMFSKKETKNEEGTASKSRDGGAIYISGGALILIIILLIILL